MSKKRLDIQTYPKFLFLAEEGEKGLQWYNVDPMKAGDSELTRVDVGKILIDMLGHCTKANPIVVQVGGAVLERSFAFDASIPTQMRTGKIAAHIRDYEGNYVEILPMRGADPDYPFNGAVLEDNGEPVAFRKYSSRGACADGLQEHSLVVFHGLMKVEPGQDLDALAEAAEEENAEDEKRDEKKGRNRSSRRRRGASEGSSMLGGDDEPGDVGNLPGFDFENL